MGEYSTARGERFDVLMHDIVPETLDMLQTLAAVMSVLPYDNFGDRFSKRRVS